MRAPCKRIGVADDGRPFCVHGPMIRRGFSRGRQDWGCSEAIHAELRGYYDRNGLRIRMRHDLNYHRLRLAEITHQTEGD